MNDILLSSFLRYGNRKKTKTKKSQVKFFMKFENIYYLSFKMLFKWLHLYTSLLCCKNIFLTLFSLFLCYILNFDENKNQLYCFYHKLISSFFFYTKMCLIQLLYLFFKQIPSFIKASISVMFFSKELNLLISRVDLIFVNMADW